MCLSEVSDQEDHFTLIRVAKKKKKKSRNFDIFSLFHLIRPPVKSMQYM